MIVVDVALIVAFLTWLNAPSTPPEMGYVPQMLFSSTGNPNVWTVTTPYFEDPVYFDWNWPHPPKLT